MTHYCPPGLDGDPDCQGDSEIEPPPKLQVLAGRAAIWQIQTISNSVFCQITSVRAITFIIVKKSAERWPVAM